MKKLISRRNFLKMGALASAVMMLAACGGGAGGGKDSGANVEVTGTVSFPLAEQVTFTGMTSYPVGSESDPNNRTIFKRLEEATNVHIDWTAIRSTVPCVQTPRDISGRCRGSSSWALKRRQSKRWEI